MLSSHSARTGSERPPAPFVRPTSWPAYYCALPQRLLSDLHDTPLAIGLYALVARLFLVAHEPIPLSRADVMRYDPQLKAGAVKRAFDRLVDRGWLTVEASASHQKQRYTPTWGCIGGAPRAWRMDAPCLGRPRHVIRLMLDRGLLDTCMGKLTPHATQASTITRYVTTPVLSLSDVGCYALTLADLPRETVALRRLGLVRGGQALPLPAEPRLLALISQRALDLGEPAGPLKAALTLSGTRRLGITPAQAADADTTQPLFFVPPGLIGSQIGSLIGSQIGAADETQAAPAASQSAELPAPAHAAGITWESRDLAKQAIPPPTPSTHTQPSGGGAKGGVYQKSVRQRGAQTTLVKLSIPETPATRLLQTINVLPEQLLELAELPAETVMAAIEDGKARPGVRDLAGWTVKLLRSHRDHCWKIAPPTPPADSPEALRAYFAWLAPDDVPAAADPAPEPPERSLDDVWRDALAQLRLRVPRDVHASCTRYTKLLSVSNEGATIGVTDMRLKDTLEHQHATALCLALSDVVRQDVVVRMIVHSPTQLEGIS